MGATWPLMVADAAGVGGIEQMGQALRLDRAVGVQPPIVDDEGNVAIDRNRLGFLDDEQAVKAAVLLHDLMSVRVIPERARVRYFESVIERLARLDGRLCEMSHAVHGIVDADAVPMDRGRLADAVAQPRADFATLPDANFRAGNASSVTPDARWFSLWEEPGRAGLGSQRNGAIGHSRMQTARQQRISARAGHRSNERATRDRGTRPDWDHVQLRGLPFAGISPHGRHFSL